MSEEKKDGLEELETNSSVENKTKYGDIPVEEQGMSVENMGIAKDEENENGENAQPSVEEDVDNPEKVVGNIEGNREETVDNMEREPDFVEEAVDNVEKGAEAVGNPNVVPKKKGGQVALILLGLVLFAGVLYFCWNALGGGVGKTADTGVLYAKENNLYVYDLKNDPYLVQEGISDGGGYSYYYTAWGAKFSMDSSKVGYLAHVDESNAGEFYIRDGKNPKAEGVLVDKGVLTFNLTEDGSKATYVKVGEDQETLQLYIYDGSKSFLAADKVVMEDSGYSMSQDGTYVAYVQDENGKRVLYTRGMAEGDAPVQVGDQIALFAIAEKTNTVYFVNQGEESYGLYSYVFGNEPTMVAEDVTYMEVLQNGKDVLYCVAQENIPYTAIIEDDITDITQYDAERQAAIEGIRQTLTSVDGVESLFMDCYLLTEEGGRKLDKSVISLVGLDSEDGYFVGFSAAAPAPVKLSEANSLDDALSAYYYAMAFGEKETFVGNTAGEIFVLKDSNASPSSVKVSADGKNAAYFVQNVDTGASTLMLETLGGEGEPIQIAENVQEMRFLGKSSTLGYYYNYGNGMGEKGIFKNNEATNQDKNISGIYFAEDRESVYYVANADPATGNGQMMVDENGSGKLIDEDVFSFVYKGNGKLIYLKSYDLTTGLGDLYYYDGGKPRLLDEGITAIYMY